VPERCRSAAGRHDSYLPVPLVPPDGTKDDQERFRSTLLPPHGTPIPVE
jgi:hypothetical protein